MSTDPLSKPVTAFDGSTRLWEGTLVEVALAVKAATDAGAAGPLLVFDDATGRVLDLDLRGSTGDVVRRLVALPPEPARTPPAPPAPSETEGEASEPRGRGRPKLGVIGKEVTLLPRHWDWLAAQPGGASVALRKLVDEARRAAGPRAANRAAQEAAYRVMSALSGDLPGYEEALRALFAGDRAAFESRIAAWPQDVAGYVTRLAYGGA